MLHVIHLSRPLERNLGSLWEGGSREEGKEGREGSKILLILIFAMVC